MSSSVNQKIQNIVRDMATESRDGRGLTRLDRLVQLQRLMEAGGIQTMEPLLPLALTLNGKPYHMADHAPFSPMFRTQLPKNLLYVTARQVGKSLSTAARGLMLSVSQPNFRTLYITPLYEQIRRFSNNYMRPFIDQSPIRSLWTGTNTENSVLQRSFKNLSTMLFSFALLDADRLRGIACDSISVDECAKIGTMVETPIGHRAIEAFLPGDCVTAFDEDGNIHDDEIVTCSDRGVRDCFRFETANGAVVEVTSNAWLATTSGWKRVATIVADACARADAFRNDVGRWASPGPEYAATREYAEPVLLEPTRVLPTRLQLPKIPGLIQVCTQAARESEELRLREMAERLADAEFPGLLNYRLLVSPRRQEARDASVVERNNLGGDSLVVPGRWLASGQAGDVSYGGVQRGRGDIAGQLAMHPRLGRLVETRAEPAQSGEVLSLGGRIDGVNLHARRENSSLHFSGDAAQDRSSGETIRSALPMVRSRLRAHKARLHGTRLSQLLWQRSVSLSPESGHETTLRSTSRDSCAAQRTDSGAILRRSSREPRKVAASGRSQPPGESRGAQGGQATLSPESPRSAPSTGLDLQALRINRGTGHAEERQEILRGLPRDRNTGDSRAWRGQEARRASRSECSTNNTVPVLSVAGAGEPGLGRSAEILLGEVQDGCEQRTPESGLRGEESEIVKITWTGRHRVFDIETKKYSTFIAGGIFTHNCQDFDPGHLPIAREAMSHSNWAISTFTGTPKTLDNPIYGMWKRSSQAEWVTKCQRPGCGAWNIPSLEFHVDKMIGDWHEDISEQRPGTICYKCAKPINPRGGHWIHRYPDRRFKMAGYHVPQIILPLHFARPDKWAELRAKREGWGNTPINVFYNEVLGESVDAGQKLVTETQLRLASVLRWKNNPREPHPDCTANLAHYLHRFMCVDWGGGGEEGVSFTVLAVLGLRSDGKIDCLWGKRLVLSQEHLREAHEIQRWFNYFHCDMLVHDYTGAGTVRETVLVQAGLPLDRVMPVTLMRAAHQSLMRHIPPTPIHNRAHYRLDKPRSLLYTCQAIKTGLLRFFEYDSDNSDNPGLIGDFLALVEEKAPSRLGADIYTITRNTMLSDDFAQAVNIGCAAIWHINGWPNFAEAAAVARITRAQMEAAGAASYGWDDDLVEHGPGQA